MVFTRLTTKWLFCNECSLDVGQLSPDEKQVAVVCSDQSAASLDIWLIELSRGVASRFN